MTLNWRSYPLRLLLVFLPFYASTLHSPLHTAAALKLSVPKTLRFENAETLRFLFRAPAIFWRCFGDFCGETCDFELCDLKTQRFFCDFDFVGTLSFKMLAQARGLPRNCAMHAHVSPCATWIARDGHLILDLDAQIASQFSDPTC